MSAIFFDIKLIDFLQESFRDISGGGNAYTFEANEDAGLAMESGDTTTYTGELTFDDFDVIAKLGGKGIVEINSHMLIMLHGDTDEMAHLLERNGHLSIVTCIVLAGVIVHEPELPGLTMRLVFKRYRTILIISELFFARVRKKHIRQSGFLFHYALAVADARYGERGRER